MNKFRMLTAVSALAACCFATGVFAQEATSEMPMGSDMSTDMMGMTSHVRIAYMVTDGPAVDVYVAPGMMGDMMGGMSGDMGMMMTDEAGMMMTPDMGMMMTDEAGMMMTPDMSMGGMMEGMSELGILINTLTPGIVTEFLAAPVGDYSVTITAQGDMAPVVGPLPVALTGGEFLTVAVVGSVANNTVQVIVLPEALGSYTAGGAVVTVVNAIEGSPDISIQTADGISLVPSLGFVGAMGDMGMGEMGDAMMMTDEAGMMMTPDPMMGDMMGAMVPMTIGTPATVFVPAEFVGAYNIRVINNADGAELAAFDGVEVAADTAYLIVAYSLDGATVQLATGTFNLADMMMMGE